MTRIVDENSENLAQQHAVPPDSTVVSADISAASVPAGLPSLHPEANARLPAHLQDLTDRARGFLQAAQTIAIRDYHQRITPEHLTKALLDDEQGAAAGLIAAAGGDAARVKVAVEAELTL